MEVILPDGRINENGQRRMACFRGHGSGIALLRPPSMTGKAIEGLYLLPLDKFMDRCDDRLGFVLCRGDLHEVIDQIPGQGDRRPFHETLRHKNYTKSYGFSPHMSRKKSCANESHRKMVPGFPDVFLLEKGGPFGYIEKESKNEKDDAQMRNSEFRWPGKKRNLWPAPVGKNS